MMMSTRPIYGEYIPLADRIAHQKRVRDRRREWLEKAHRKNPRCQYCGLLTTLEPRNFNSLAKQVPGTFHATLDIAGRYIEHTPEGSFERKAGEIVRRAATAMHRIELFPGERAITLFTTGPRVREWGFQCPQGWVHWRDFTAGENGEHVGKGCAQ